MTNITIIGRRMAAEWLLLSEPLLTLTHFAADYLLKQSTSLAAQRRYMVEFHESNPQKTASQDFPVSACEDAQYLFMGYWADFKGLSASLSISTLPKH